MASFADISIRFGADLRQFSSQMQNARRDFAKVGKDLQKVGAGLTVGVTAPLLAVGAAAIQAYSELEGVQQGFDRLNDANLLKDLREATKGTVTNLELMKAAVQANNFKIPLTELSTLLDFARRRAKETGENVDFLVNSIVTGIGRKSPLILDNLGISATALRDELGGASAAASSIADVTAAVGKIARAELEAMGEDALTLKEIYLQFKTNIANSLGEIGGILAETLKPAIAFAKDLSDGFASLSPETKKFIVVLAGVAAALGPLLVTLGVFTAKILPALKAGFLVLGGPVSIAVAALAAVGILIYKNWEPIKETLVELANYFVDLYNESIIFRGGVELVIAQFKNLLATGKFVIAVIGEGFSAIGQNIKNTFSSLGAIIKAILTGDLSSIPSIIASGFKEGISTAKGLVGDIKEDFATLKDTIEENVSQGLNNTLRGKKYELIGSNVDTTSLKNEVAKAVTNGLAEGASSAVDLTPKQDKVGLSVDVSGVSELGNLDFGGTLLETIQAPRISQEIQNLMDRLLEFRDRAREILQESAVNFVQGFGTIVGAIASGASGVDAFGGFLLSSLGQVLIDLGKLAIRTAITIGAIQVALKSLNPVVATIAGVAAIALGTIIKNQVSKIGNFANGGVIPGNSFSGDRLLAGVNSGELILNLAQQKNLVGALSNNGTNVTLTPSLRYDAGGFRIMLENENKRLNRVT